MSLLEANKSALNRLALLRTARGFTRLLSLRTFQDSIRIIAGIVQVKCMMVS